MLTIEGVERSADKVLQRYSGYSVALVGCMADGFGREGCIPDLFVFPHREHGQEIWKEGRAMLRVIRDEQPPTEEIRSLVPLVDPEMRAAGLKSSWTADRHLEYLSLRARMEAIEALDLATKGLESLERGGTPYYYTVASAIHLIDSSLLGRGVVPRPSHVLMQVKENGARMILPKEDLAGVRRRAGVVGRMLKELEQDVEAYVFGRKANRLIASGRLADAALLIYHEMAYRVQENVAITYIGEMQPTVGEQELEGTLRAQIEEGKRLWIQLSKHKG